MERKLTPIARRLRRNATDAEAMLWRRLRSRQLEDIKFRRQFPIGRYIVDFVSIELKLVIEFDGGQHAESLADTERTRWIEANGYTVIRFWNNDVVENLDGVLEAIRREILNARTR